MMETLKVNEMRNTNDKTKAAYETTDPQTKTKVQKGTALKRSEGDLLEGWGLNLVFFFFSPLL